VSLGRRSERGAAAFRAIIVVTIFGAGVYGLYKGGAWVGHHWVSWVRVPRVWWHQNIADPVFRLLVKALSVARGSVFVALALVALAFWLLARFMGAFSAFAFRSAGDQRQIMAERVIGQMENIQSKLNKLFADDVEKIALFRGPQFGQTNPAVDSVPVSGGAGCLIGVIWGLFSVSFMTLVGIAIYDGILRLFVIPEPADSLLRSAGVEATDLQRFLPIARSSSIDHFIAVNFNERSLFLTAVVAVLGLLVWLVGNISHSGWTLPRVVGPSPMVAYAFLLILSYRYLQGALLIFAMWLLSYSLVLGTFWRFLFVPLFLKVKAQMRPRRGAAIRVG
jgi:hypothetical protein